MQTIIFDVDGVLIEADGKIRVVKYKKLFKLAMKLVKSPEYAGANWFFSEIKHMYDKGIDINPRHYTLIEKDAAKTLVQLSKNYKLVACSLAAKEITIKKLKKTGLLRYFSDVIEKSDSVLANEEAIFVDDRPQNFGNNITFIRFCYGQHQKMNASPHLEINSIKELIHLTQKE